MCCSKQMLFCDAEFTTHCGQDAVLAAEAGVDGILISNHGGKQPQCPSLLSFIGKCPRSSA